MNLNLIKSDRFGNTPADIYSNGKDMYMTAAQLGECLGYSNARESINKIVQRNEYLRNPEFSAEVKMTSPRGDTQNTRVFTEDGIYEVTMLAKTEKAKEFRAWVRKLIKSIRHGEVKVVPMTEYQRLTAETKQANARARQAAILLKIADKTPVKEYAQVLHSHAAAIIAGKPILPLPEVDKPTYSAEEIGQMFGISRQMVGRIANAHGLKKPEYGKLFYDKAAHSNKQVETFRYYDSALPEFKKLIKEVETRTETQSRTKQAPEGYKVNPEFIETKTKRVQLLLQPSVVDAIKALAKRQGLSMNEAISQAIQEYVEKNNG